MSSESNKKCFFRYPSGDYCKRWAQHGSHFCFNHQPQGASGPAPGVNRPTPDGWPSLHPHVRLAMPIDLFNLVRETLNGVRMGRVPPGQAMAISALCGWWLKLYEKLDQDARLHAMQAQILPTLVDAETAAREEQIARAEEQLGQQEDMEATLERIIRFGPQSVAVPGANGETAAAQPQDEQNNAAPVAAAAAGNGNGSPSHRPNGAPPAEAWPRQEADTRLKAAAAAKRGTG